MNEQNQMVDWLEEKLRQLRWNSRVHQNAIRRDGEWYYVPVYVDMTDAYDKAVVLQEIEETWEQEQPQPGHNLLLIPAAN